MLQQRFLSAYKTSKFVSSSFQLQPNSRQFAEALTLRQAANNKSRWGGVIITIGTLGGLLLAYSTLNYQFTAEEKPTGNQFHFSCAKAVFPVLTVILAIL